MSLLRNFAIASISFTAGWILYALFNAPDDPWNEGGDGDDFAPADQGA